MPFKWRFSCDKSVVSNFRLAIGTYLTSILYFQFGDYYCYKKTIFIFSCKNQRLDGVCTLRADPKLFLQEDSCPDTPKYLEVQYNCIQVEHKLPSVEGRNEIIFNCRIYLYYSFLWLKSNNEIFQCQ